MKKECSKKYGLNLKYELETYRHVGKDYGDRKNANRGWLFNFIRFLRKKFNQKEKRYKFCNTYSEWKRHVKEIIPKNICNYDDFLHFLILERKDAETYLETFKIILIPIYIAMFGMNKLFPMDNPVTAIGTIITIAGFSSCIVYFEKKKVEFYEDLIEVVKEEMVESIKGDKKIVSMYLLRI